MNPFSLWLALGCTLGLWQAVHQVAGSQRWLTLLAGLGVLLGALAGARLGYACLHPAVFRSQPWSVLWFWQGGLTWIGAPPGALLALWLLARRMGNAPLELANALLPLLPAVAAATWLGCWGAGCAYGLRLPEGTWWGILAIDEEGHLALRWPLQPLAGLSLVGVFWGLEYLGHHLSPGQRVGWGGLVFALHSAFFSLLRADSPPVWNGWRLDVVLAVLIGLMSLGVLVVSQRSWPRRAEA